MMIASRRSFVLSRRSPANRRRLPLLPPALVTARKPGKRYAEVPEVSEEERRRVGDLAAATMAEFRSCPE
jgi:hypothetical protein